MDKKTEILTENYEAEQESMSAEKESKVAPWIKKYGTELVLGMGTLLAIGSYVVW